LRLRCSALFQDLQSVFANKKVRPQLAYIKQWVPELNELTYPAPIVDHELARKRCLETYKKALDR
jgi:deoxyribodipyrimidine photo-lyase